MRFALQLRRQALSHPLALFTLFFVGLALPIQSHLGWFVLASAAPFFLSQDSVQEPGLQSLQSLIVVAGGYKGFFHAASPLLQEVLCSGIYSGFVSPPN